MKKVYVIHSGIQHVLQAVKAFQEAELLEKFYTSLILNEKTAGALRRLGGKKLDKVLTLRQMSDLDHHLIGNNFRYELFEITAKMVFGRNTWTVNTLPHWRDRRVARAAARKIDPECRAVFGFPNNVLESFQKVGPSTIKILEQPIGHNRVALRIFEEERNLHPEFADSITFGDSDAAYLSRLDEEIQLADRITVPSAFVKKTMTDEQVDPQKMRVIPYGSFIPARQTLMDRTDQELRLIFVGQLSQRKGIKYLLDAVRFLKKQKIPVYFTLIGRIYGSGGWFSAYREYIDEYHPALSREQLSVHYSRSDLFILPSLFEGSALVLYEALAHGVACMVTPNAGMDAVVDGVNGLVIPIRDSDAIVQGVTKMYRHPDLLHEYRENALHSARQAGWENYRKALVDLVQHESQQG